MPGTTTKVAAKQIIRSENDYKLKDAGNGLFAIVSDYCGHCNVLKKNVVEAQKTGTLNFYFLNGDADDAETKALLRGLNVEGFPDMYSVHPTGSLVSYDGPRDPQALIQSFGSKVSSSGGASSSFCRWRKIALFILAVVIGLILFGRVRLP